MPALVAFNGGRFANRLHAMAPADGAMTTGIREAKRLLQQPAVALTAR